MADSELDNELKEKNNAHFHDIYNGLHAQLSAEDTRNVDKNDSADESGESPLDFSLKRKSRNYDEVSGSDSISSPASSNTDTGGHAEYRKSEFDERVPYFNGSISNESTDNVSINESQHHLQSQLNEHSDGSQQIGEPRTALPNGSPVPGLPGMLSGLQMGLASNANMLASAFPAMSALMDPRRAKNSRPFKAYPKDPMSLPVGGMGVPSYLTSFANFENSMLTQGLNLSSEEIFTIYKQQLMLIREREKYLESLKISQQSSRTSTVTSPPKPSFSSSSPTHYNNNNNNNINKNNGVNSHSSYGSVVNGASSAPIDSPTLPGGGSNPLTASGRRRPRSLPDEQKDESYWERRRKNNEAAKRSRDARRAKEDEIAIRAALLEQENLKLRVEVAALKTETAKLRCMLYNS